MQQLKVVVLGDTKVGKTSMLRLFTKQGLQAEYQETVQTSTADFVVKDLKLNNKTKVQINFHDTSGNPEMVRMRTMCYNSTDVFLLCFDVAERASFRNACRRWVAEARAHQPGARMVLVGLDWGGEASAKQRRQLAATPRRPPAGAATPGKAAEAGPVTVQEAHDAVSQLDAFGYFEIGLRTGEGVQEALQGIVQIGNEASHGKKAAARMKHMSTPSRGAYPAKAGAGPASADGPAEDEQKHQPVAHIDIRQRNKKDVKVVVLGDSRVGKTTLLYTYVHGKPPASDEYEPSVGGSEVFSPHVHKIRNASYKLSLWDMSGNPEHRRLRYIGYPDTDVFLICFDIGDARSLENCVKQWGKEAHNNVPTAPVLLVGLKSDLRKGNDDSASEEAARAAVARIDNCVGYVECSCRGANFGREQKDAVEAVFGRAIASCVSVPTGKSCVIL